MFAEDAPRCLAILHQAVRDRDPVALADGAHQLKTICRTVGANGLGTLLDEVEDAGRQRSLENGATRVTEVERRLRTVVIELQNSRGKWRGAPPAPSSSRS